MEAVRYFSSVINGHSTAELQYLLAVTIYSNNNYYNYIRTSKIIPRTIVLVIYP